jgi:hypothetical protein
VKRSKDDGSLCANSPAALSHDAESTSCATVYTVSHYSAGFRSS